MKDKALAYYHANLDRISNRKYLSIVDFSLRSSSSRFLS